MYGQKEKKTFVKVLVFYYYFFDLMAIRIVIFGRYLLQTHSISWVENLQCTYIFIAVALVEVIRVLISKLYICITNFSIHVTLIEFKFKKNM